MLFPAYVFAEMWYAPAAAITQDLVFPSLRGLATAIYFIVNSLGALAPLLVGALNEIFDQKAPYSDDDDGDSMFQDTVRPLDPTYPMVIVIAGSYFFSAIGFWITSLFLKGHKARVLRLLDKEQFSEIIPQREAEAFAAQMANPRFRGRLLLT